MTSPDSASPPDQPLNPAAAAQALAEAAQAAARAWSRPLDPARYTLAISQLYSTLGDLGLAARELAAFQTARVESRPERAAFSQSVATTARWLLNAWQSLDGVLPAEASGPGADPAEPGTALCQAAGTAFLAWTRPTGTVADRDATIGWFITAAGFLSVAILGLMAHTPRRSAIDLHVVGDSLAESIAYLTAAIHQPAGDIASEDGA